MEDMWGQNHTAGKLFFDYLSDFLNSLSRAMQVFVMKMAKLTHLFGWVYLDKKARLRYHKGKSSCKFLLYFSV